MRCAARLPIPDATQPPLLRQRRERRRAANRAITTCSRRSFRIASTATRSTRTSTSASTATRARKTAFSQAIPVSATHYIDRGGKVLDAHLDAALLLQAVPRGAGAVQPLVGNRFRGRRRGGEGQPAPPRRQEIAR